MRRLFKRVAVGTVGLMVLTGCNPSPYLPSSPTAAAWQQTPVQTPPTNQAEMFDLNRRATALDANNRDLHAQLAQSRQQVQLMQQQVSLLQKQLSETAQRLQQTQVAKEESQRKFEALQASTTRRGGAIITANTSTRQSLRLIEIPGLQRPPGRRYNPHYPTHGSIVSHRHSPTDRHRLPGVGRPGGRIGPQLPAAVDRHRRAYRQCAGGGWCQQPPTGRRSGHRRVRRAHSPQSLAGAALLRGRPGPQPPRRSQRHPSGPDGQSPDRNGGASGNRRHALRLLKSRRNCGRMPLPRCESKSDPEARTP